MPVTDEQLSGLRVAVLGNTDTAVYWSTENEYVDAWERVGATVDRYHEKHPDDWDRLIDDIRNNQFDLVQWTSTKDFRDRAGKKRQVALSVAAKDAGTPLVGVHLDVWIGLEREHNIIDDPWYFVGCDILFTADGGHQKEWAGYGVNHRWLLPAISERWVGLGTPTERYRSDIAFVGSWQGGYHRESKHRHQLVEWLQQTYGDRVRFWPKRLQPRIVGRDLNDLYASTNVVVGDSCWLPGWTNYCSDRIPESLGRGAYLLHPATEGINAGPGDPFWRHDAPLCDHWAMWDWDELRARIDTELEEGSYSSAEERQRRVDWIAESHTYTHRCREIVEIMDEEGLL